MEKLKGDLASQAQDDQQAETNMSVAIAQFQTELEAPNSFKADSEKSELRVEARERDGAMRLVQAALDKAGSHIDEPKRDGRQRERDFTSSHAALLELAEERTLRIEKLLVALGY